MKDSQTQNGTRSIEDGPVRTTIVGARPPGQGRARGNIPRGIEVLVKKASIDPDFHALLLSMEMYLLRRKGMKKVFSSWRLRLRDS